MCFSWWTHSSKTCASVQSRGSGVAPAPVPVPLLDDNMKSATYSRIPPTRKAAEVTLGHKGMGDICKTVSVRWLGHKQWPAMLRPVHRPVGDAHATSEAVSPLCGIHCNPLCYAKREGKDWTCTCIRNVDGSPGKVICLLTKSFKATASCCLEVLQF